VGKVINRKGEVWVCEKEKMLTAWESESEVFSIRDWSQYQSNYLSHTIQILQGDWPGAIVSIY
jgi:hypothetical protein